MRQQSPAFASTFGRQPDLPRLPIPHLDDTLDGWREILRPVVPLGDMPNVDSILKAFRSSMAPVLQRRLRAYEQSIKRKVSPDLMRGLILEVPSAKGMAEGLPSPYSWLESIWYEYGYLRSRDPLPIGTSWWCLFRNHPDRPRNEPHEPDQALNFPRVSQAKSRYHQGYTDYSLATCFTTFQLERAAGVISNHRLYYERLVNGLIPPDGSGSDPQCMHQLRMIFGVTRIPTTLGYDVLRTRRSVDEERYVIVMCKGHPYRLYLYDKGTRLPYNLKTIQGQLKVIVEDASQASNRDDNPSISILTSMNRDKWGQAREYLQRLSAANDRSLDIVEGALFCVCLDSFSVGPSTSRRLHVMACGMEGCNRWFDISQQNVFLADGSYGVNSEHSPADALVQSYPNMYAVDHEPAQDVGHVLPEDGGLTVVVPEKLNFVIDDHIRNLLKEAYSDMRKIFKSVDADVIEFRDYGTDEIRKYGISSDAWIQLGMQLAYFRLHGRFPPTYETAGTRKYLHGRTDTMRPLTTESTEFVLAMESPVLPRSQKMAAFRAAASKHMSLLKCASAGQACDRHLLALRAMLQPSERCEFFENPLTSPNGLASDWKLSTSAFGSRTWQYFVGTGFGFLKKDVYGVNYLLAPHLLRLCVFSHRQSEHANTVRFNVEVRRVLKEMRDMCRLDSLEADGKSLGDVGDAQKGGRNGAHVEAELERSAGLPYPYVSKL